MKRFFTAVPDRNVTVLFWRWGGGARLLSRLSMRAPLPTTDALFAQEVEQKMSNLLAGFGAAGGFELRCDAS